MATRVGMLLPLIQLRSMLRAGRLGGWALGSWRLLGGACSGLEGSALQQAAFKKTLADETSEAKVGQGGAGERVLVAWAGHRLGRR